MRYQSVLIRKCKNSSRTFPGLLVLWIVAFISQPLAYGQNALPQPTLLSLYPGGAKAGETIEVEILEQNDLHDATGLLFSHPGITAQPVMAEADRYFPQARPVRGKFSVTIAANTPPGFYECRAVCRYGVSNARRFQIGALPESNEVEPNDNAETAGELPMNSTVNGTFDAEYDCFRLNVLKGQQVVIECVAERIDSRADAVLVLQDDQGNRIALDQDSVGLDPVITINATEDRTYIVLVHDLTFTASGGRGTAPYRLTAREGAWIDFVDPPYAIAGQNQQLTLYGRNLGGQPTGKNVAGSPLETLQVNFNPAATPAAIADVVQLPFSATSQYTIVQHAVAGKMSNRVSLALLNQQPVAEIEPNNDFANAQQIEIDKPVIGRFDQAGDLDRYRFSALKDEKFSFRIASHQWGNQSDLLLAVQAADDRAGKLVGRDLKVADDENENNNNTFRFDWSSNDPSLEFVAPSDGDFYLVVQNQFAITNQVVPAWYQLSARRSANDFELLACGGLAVGQNGNLNFPLNPTACVIRKGGSAEITLVAKRHPGFSAPLEVTVQGLPQGVSADKALIGTNEIFATLILRADPGVSAWQGAIEISATATIDGQQIKRTAVPVEIVWPPLNNNNQMFSTTRAGDRIFLSIDDQTPVPGRIETPQTTLRMASGGRLEVPLKFVKQGEFVGGLNSFASGLPQAISRNNVNLPADGNEAKLNLSIQPNCPPGTYGFFVRCDADVDFKSYPELLDVAKEDQQRINTVLNELQTAYQKSTQAKSAAEQQFQQASQQRTATEGTLNQRRQQLAQFETSLSAVQKELDAAQQKFEAAMKALEQATKTAEETQDPAAKQQAQTVVTQRTQELQAAKSALDAVANRKVAAEKQTADGKSAMELAEKEMKAAQEKQEQAEKDRKLAIETEAQALQDRNEGQQKKTAADQWFQRANQISQQRRIKASVYSPMLTIEVVPFAIEFTLDQPAYQVKAGEKINVVVTSKRDFETNDEIRFQLRPPSGIGGWSIAQNALIKKGENQSSLELAFAENARDGKFAAELVATYRFDNRSVTQSIPIQIEVLPADKPKE